MLADCLASMTVKNCNFLDEHSCGSQKTPCLASGHILAGPLINSYESEVCMAPDPSIVWMMQRVHVMIMMSHDSVLIRACTW